MMERSQRVVAIGASTGGPRALLEVLMALPADLPAGIVIVQHMPAQFTATMARRFNGDCALNVREAQHGDRFHAGEALIAPGGCHLRLNNTGRIVLTDEPPYMGIRPSVDYMMEGIAAVCGANALGVLLTGMGRDGAAGLGAIRRAHGATIAQDEASCVIFGMPRAAIEAGVVDQVAPLSQIADLIIEWCAGGRRKRRRYDT